MSVIVVGKRRFPAVHDGWGQEIIKEALHPDVVYHLIVNSPSQEEVQVPISRLNTLLSRKGLNSVLVSVYMVLDAIIKRPTHVLEPQ